MKPFDLEAAKRGEPICFLDQLKNIQSATLVGVTTLGNPVVELRNGSVFDTFPNSLCMAPKKVTVRYRIGLYRDDDGLHPFLVTSDFGANIFATLHRCTST